MHIIWCSSAQNTLLFVLTPLQNTLLSTKHPSFCSDTTPKHHPQHKTPLFLFWHPSKTPPLAQNTPYFVLTPLLNHFSAQSLHDMCWDLLRFSGRFEKMPIIWSDFPSFVCILMENMLRFLSRFGASPKCEKEIFNKVRNCVKTRNLAFKFFGPKCWKFLQKMFVFQKNLLPLHPLNWGLLRPTSWYSIS